MAVIYLIITYIVFLLFLMVINYYIYLLQSKDQYTKEEISKVHPYISDAWGKVSSKYSILEFIAVFIISSFVGLLVPFFSSNWFFQSSILFVIFFFALPLIKERFQGSMVKTSEYYRDRVANIFSKYIMIILIGFGAGNGTSLMFNWVREKELNFLWFLINLIVVIILLERGITKELNEN